MSIDLKRINTLNKRMINKVIKKGYLKRQLYRKAFDLVKRHYFVPQLFTFENGKWVENKIDYENPDFKILKQIYVDKPLAFLVKDDQVVSTTSQPTVMAMMIEAAELEPGMKIMEIGTGSGYNAAILSEIVGGQENVISVEIDRQVFNLAKENLERANYKKVSLINKDGGFSDPTRGPYDSIMVTCACTDLSRRWIDQLKLRGTLVLPLATRGLEALTKFEKIQDKKLRGTPSTYVRFLNLQGFSSNINHYQKTSKRHENIQKMIMNTKFDYEMTEMFSQNFHKRKIYDFIFYLSIVEKDTISYFDDSPRDLGDGFGIWSKDPENKGVFLIFNGKVIHSGSTNLKEKIKEYVDRFHELGEPSLKDYTIEISSAIIPPEKREKVWTLKRRNLTTTYILNK